MEIFLLIGIIFTLINARIEPLRARQIAYCLFLWPIFLPFALAPVVMYGFDELKRLARKHLAKSKIRAK